MKRDCSPDYREQKPVGGLVISFYGQIISKKINVYLFISITVMFLSI